MMVQKMTKTVYVDNRKREFDTFAEADLSEARLEVGRAFAGIFTDDQIDEILARIEASNEVRERMVRYLKAITSAESAKYNPRPALISSRDESIGPGVDR